MADEMQLVQIYATKSEGQFVQDLLKGIRRSRNLHKWEGKGQEYAIHAAYEEANELLCAYYHHEGEERIKSEALDTCITAAKVYMQEYK